MVTINIGRKEMFFFSIAILMFVVAGFVVALGSVPNPGHAISELQTCENGETLVMVNGAWECGSAVAGALIKTGTYTGTGAAGNIVDVGFEPDNIIIIPHQNYFGSSGFKTNFMEGSFALYFGDYGADRVSITTTGFELGTTNSYYNVDGYIYSYVAMKDN